MKRLLASPVNKAHQLSTGAWIARQSTELCLWSYLLLCLFCGGAVASDVLYVTAAGKADSNEEQIRLVSSFYGLDVQRLEVRSSRKLDLASALKQSGAEALIVSSWALRDIEPLTRSRALRRIDGSFAPVLIIVEGPGDNSSELSAWTGGLVQGCEAVAGSHDSWKLAFATEARGIAPLAGLRVASGAPVCGLKVGASVQALATAEDQGVAVPTFVRLDGQGSPVFVASSMTSLRGTQGSKLQEVFSHFAGPLIFLHLSGGNRGWHLPGRYANLTIDDPWLTEPYGNLNYEALLVEMEKHDFHTTIAFVPWNFDRSQPQVVSLFEAHKDRFSLSIHGNNHNHREFGAYQQHGLGEQDNNLKQALARMENLKRTTGLAYEPVMVFPHAIAPAKTFSSLKKYNYWGTVNSENIPLGSKAPPDPLYLLRPWTLDFQNFLSIKRVSVEVPVPRETIAINAFLDNPQLFYVHQEFFEKGSSAFNGIADQVNQLAPGTKWLSLGSIVEHLYLLRPRRDGDYDVLALAPKIRLDNPTSHRVTFHIRKPEDFAIPLSAVTVDGAEQPYVAATDEVKIDVVVEPKQTKTLAVSYSNNVNIDAVDLGKRSVAINTTRHLSDFRDLYLSRSSLGRLVQVAYSNWQAAENLSRLRGVLLFLTLCIAGAFGVSNCCLLLRVR
jgi:peptidoglycan/xylan/chitin deacetylase (PgdA/CDA1 family)